MKNRQKDWTNILFLGLSPVAGILGTALYARRFGIAWWQPLLCLTFVMLIGLAIGSGYHRYYAHRTYECHPAIQAYHLFFGALALQNSVLKWARDHREHHRFVDTDDDPYNIKRGFLWAHMFWIFYKEPEGKGFAAVPDLTRDRMVMFQSRWATVIGIVGGLGLPTLVGAFFGSPLAGLLWGGFLRIVIVHHTTFFINSLAHMWGSRPYSEANSARDNGFLAFFTHGEAYHNFHHAFPSDFRNGIRWYHWDPNKWFIGVLSSVNLSRNLKSTPPPLIEKARLQVALKKSARRLEEASPQTSEKIRERIDRSRKTLEEALALWQAAQARRRDLRASGRRAPSHLVEELRRMRADYEARFDEARREWRSALAMLTALPAAA
jgi:stearoyl-CoA desaturase (Delta-9 desaturase)